MWPARVGFPKHWKACRLLMTALYRSDELTVSSKFNTGFDCIVRNWCVITLLTLLNNEREK